MTNGTALPTWADRLEAALAKLLDNNPLNRVVVLAETNSTQDAARRLCSGRPGLVVATARQTAGRGRLGRRWFLPPDHGIAISVVLGPEEPGLCALRVGLAGAITAERATGGQTAIGLKWPNDVVVTADSRKLAGVLVERAEGEADRLLIAGIGLNVCKPEGGWPEELASRAASLEEIGAECDLIEASELLLGSLCEVLAMPSSEVVSAWRARNVMAGKRARFEHAGRRYSGVVESIEPTSQICLRCDNGAAVFLPALTTSLLPEA